MERFLEIARHGRNAGWRYVVTLVFGVLASMALSVAVFVPLQLTGVAPDLARQLANPSEPAAFFLATGVMFGALAIGVALAARWVQRKRISELVGRWSWRLSGLGVVGWAAFLAIATSVDFLLAPESFTVTASSATSLLAAAAFFGLIPQVFAEELVFRGLITQGLLLWLKRPAPTAILSGLIFGGVHIPNGIPQAVSATMFGVVTAWVAIRTGGLALSTGVHLANNLFGAVVVVSAQDVFRGAPALLTQNSPRLVWIDVGLAAVGLCLLAFLAQRADRQFSATTRPIAPGG